MNNLPIFVPTRWRRRELVSRFCAIGVITIFLAIRLFRWEQYPQEYETVHHFYLSLRSASGDALYTETYIRSLWGLRVAVWGTETAILLGYISAYFTRTRAVSVARGFMETLFPLFIAGLPILISFAPYNLPQRVPLTSHLFFPYYMLIMGLILGGGLINLLGLLTLRRAFTIMSGARELITIGLFRYVRHPLYRGHFFLFFGSLLLRLHSYTIALYAFFVFGQIVRAIIEEKKLESPFPDYAAYKKHAGMFFPKIVRRH